MIYEFRVEGHLDDHWSAWLGELTIIRHHDGTSTLTGPVADKAQLHGVLARLRDIGATLLSLNALEAPAPRGSPRPEGRAVAVQDLGPVLVQDAFSADRPLRAPREITRVVWVRVQHQVPHLFTAPEIVDR
jgi:hypothetical protein